MNALNSRERELVALGAALGSTCVPCIEHHIPEARRAGLSDGQIREAVELADAVRQVPARNVLTAALHYLDGAATAPAEAPCAGSGRPASCC